MKKSIFTVALLVAGMATAFAAQATLSLGVQEVTFIEDAALSEAFDNGYDAKAYSAGIAVKDASDVRWASWATNDLASSNFVLDFGFSAAPTADVVLAVSGVVGDIYINGLKVANGDNITIKKEDFNADGSLPKAKFAVSTKGTSICFNYNVLEINGHAGEALKIAQGATVIDQQTSIGATYSKDLSSYTGRIVVTLGTKEYQIDANPSVTVKP